MINIFINSGHSFFSLRSDLINFLLKKRKKINLYYPNNFNKINKNYNNKIKLNKIFISNNKFQIKNLVHTFFSIKKKFIKSDINLIFGTYLNFIFGIFCIFFSTKKNIFVFTGLGSFFDSKNLILIFFVKKIFLYLIKKENCFFVFYNSFDRSSLFEKKYFKKTCIINGSGITIKKKKKLNLISKRINFVFYSRINRHKGINELLSAIEELNKNEYDKYFNLNIYGLFDNNPTSLNKNEFLNRIKKLKNCHYYKTSYNVNLKKNFSNNHFFILPSHREGLPKTALEAMLHNNGLLISNIPAHSKLISTSRRNGLFFKVKSVQDLKKKMIWLINNKSKANLFIKNSFYNVKRFDNKIINQKFYEFIFKK
jgi:glycosyltransferase involved in cell wall biosynthesis